MHTLYRRHEQTCRWKKLGVRHIKCSCPIWMDGYDLKGIRQRRSMKTRNWSHAQARLADLETGRAPAPDKSPALTAAVKSYLDDCRARKLAPASIVSYTNTLGHLTNYFGDRRVSAIDLVALTNFRNNRKCSAANSMKEIQTIRAFFKFAKVRKWIEDNPAVELKPPQADRLPTMPFTVAEVTALLDACDRIDNANPREIPRARLRARALLLVLLYSGLRISDAVKLERAALDKTGRLMIRMMKTRVAMYIRLPQVALDALAAVPRESAYFFWSGTAKLSTAVGSARRTIACVVKLADVKNGHPHRFRDTFSVSLLQNGVDLRTVQLLLGHQSIRTTEKHYAPYVASMQRALDDAVSTLHFSGGLPAHALVDPKDDALRNPQGNLLPFARTKRAKLGA